MFWDKRRQLRVGLKTRINIDSASNFYTGFSENISAGGLFVSTTQLRELGEAVKVRFTLPDAGPPIETQAVVRWVREANPASDTTPGYGVQFEGLSERDEARINAFIEQRSPIFYME